MRAAAILGLGCSPKDLKPFQSAQAVDWRMGMPASAEEADVILIFGGDGTVHRHLGQLVRLGQPVLVVPAGSGNDFARALGICSVKHSLALWRKFCLTRDQVRAIDLGVVAGSGSSSARGAIQRHYFACVAGVGLDAEVARRANKLPRWLRAHGGYVLALLPSVFRFTPVPMKISTYSEPRDSWSVRNDGPTLLAAFANAPIYGGGMKIAPQAKLDDGLLDVCVVGEVDPFKLFCLFPTVYAGRHLQVKEVSYWQAARVQIETERPVDVYADGEYVCTTPVEIGTERSALRVLTEARAN